MIPEFRVWDKEREWFLNDDMFIELDGTLWDDSDSKYNTPNKEIERAKTDRYVIEQFIGKLDINGKKIFKGDKVKCENYHGEVEGDISYNNSYFYLACSSGYSDEYLFNCFNLEIIGNIHEGGING